MNKLSLSLNHHHNNKNSFKSRQKKLSSSTKSSSSSKSFKTFSFFCLFYLTCLFNHFGQSYLIEDNNQEFQQIWYFGHKKTIYWSSVITDPDWITISISNNDAGTYPTSYHRILTRDIPKERGKYVVKSWAFEGLKEGTGYRINILTKDANAILAQSPTFTLSSWDDSDTSDYNSVQQSSDQNDEDDHSSQKSQQQQKQKQHDEKDDKNKKNNNNEKENNPSLSKSDKDDDNHQVMVINTSEEKTLSDQILDKTSRRDATRHNCRNSVKIKKGFVSIYRQKRS